MFCSKETDERYELLWIVYLILKTHSSAVLRYLLRLSLYCLSPCPVTSASQSRAAVSDTMIPCQRSEHRSSSIVGRTTHIISHRRASPLSPEVQPT